MLADIVKRKAIPLWIREALEKREKQKQKEMAKQEEDKDTEELKENPKPSGKSIVIKMKTDKVRRKILQKTTFVKLYNRIYIVRRAV